MKVPGQGFKPGSPGDQDAQQLGATFIIGTDGKVLLAHYNRFMGDNPEMRTLKAMVEESRKRVTA